MKYYQEFKISQSLYDKIMTLKLNKTIARNLADPDSYALNLPTIELLNRLEAGFKGQQEALKAQAEDKVEEMVYRDFQVSRIEVLELNCSEEVCSLRVKTPLEELNLRPYQVDSEGLVRVALKTCPEFFWVVEKDSPLYSPEYRQLLVEIQFYNHLLVI